MSEWDFRFSRRRVWIWQPFGRVVSCLLMEAVKQSYNTPMEAKGEIMYSSYSFLTSALDRVEWSASRPGERTPGTHWTGGWVGPRAGPATEISAKILCPCRGQNLDRPVVQAVARRCTDWATPAMDTVSISKMPVHLYETTRCSIQEAIINPYDFRPWP
jgi:hypothetical protein